MHNAFNLNTESVMTTIGFFDGAKVELDVEPQLLVKSYL
jgi:hypothetical protein